MIKPPPSMLLVDLSGVLYEGDTPIPGAVEAVATIRQAGVPMRFLTNTTRRPREILLAKLQTMGFDLQPTELFTAPDAARAEVLRAGRRPYCLVHRDLAPSLADLCTPADQADAVIVGDAAETFDYASLNTAFRVLIADPARPLIVMGDNRYFRDGDGQLSLDQGPFARLLAFAGDREPIVTGKPDQRFFHAAIRDAGIEPGPSVVMIGDDLESDVGGAQAAGLTGVLVRTGKYQPGDEHREQPRPDHTADHFPAAVAWLLDAG